MADDINQLNEELSKFTSNIANILRKLKKTGSGSVEEKELQIKYKKQIETVKDLDKKFKLVAGAGDALNKVLARSEIAHGGVNKILDNRVQAEKKREQEREKIQEKYKKAWKDLGQNMLGLADASTTGTDKLGYFTKSFEGTLAPLNALAKSLDFNVDNYRTLSSYGADFGKSLLGLRQAANDAQLPIEEFKNAIGRNAENLAALYGTVNLGTKGFSDMSNVVRRDARDSLYALGLTTEELLEYQNTYLSRQRIQGRQDFRDNALVSRQVTAYANSLNQLSRLTGIQNTELDKQVKGQQSDGVFQAYLSSLDEKTAMNTQNLIATLSAVNPALGRTAKDLLATGVPLDELGQQLTALAPGFQDAILSFKQSGDVAGTLQQLQVAAKGFQSRFQGTGGAATLLAGGLADASNAVVQLGSMSFNAAEALRAQKDAANPLTKELANFQDSAKRFKSALEYIQTNVLGTFASSLGIGMGGLKNTMDGLGNFIRDNPKKTALAIGAVIGAKYLGNIAKEIGIVYLGTSMALAKSGLMQSLFNLGKGFGKNAMSLGKGVGGIAGGLGIAYSGVGIAATAETKLGQAAGIGMGMAGGGMTGAMIGSMIAPGIGTIVGGAIGAALGGASGLYAAYGMDKKAHGGGLSINKPTLVGERGPELILPKTSGQVVPLMSSANTTGPATSLLSSATTGASMDLSGLQSTMSAVRDVLIRSENHLNKLVSVGLTQVQRTEEVKSAVSKQGNFAYVG